MSLTRKTTACRGFSKLIACRRDTRVKRIYASFVWWWRTCRSWGDMRFDLCLCRRNPALARYLWLFSAELVLLSRTAASQTFLQDEWYLPMLVFAVPPLIMQFANRGTCRSCMQSALVFEISIDVDVTRKLSKWPRLYLAMTWTAALAAMTCYVMG